MADLLADQVRIVDIESQRARGAKLELGLQGVIPALGLIRPRFS